MLYEREHFILRCGNIRLHQHGYMPAASLLPHWLQIQWNDDIQISDRVQPLAVRTCAHTRTHTHVQRIGLGDLDCVGSSEHAELIRNA